MNCPICGKPVPPSKGVKPRKYCSRKCATKAAHDLSAKRGYTRPKKYRKVCPICGEVFFAERDKQKCSSSTCGASLSAMAQGKKSRLSAKARLAIERKRLALERCRETAPITVEVRGNRVIETRGQVCIASRCNFTTHN